MIAHGISEKNKGKGFMNRKSQYHQLCWWFAITPPGSFVFPPKGGLTNRSFLLLVTA